MWVRKGSGPSASVVFASVADRYTVPAGGGSFSGAELELLLEPRIAPLIKCRPASATARSTRRT